MSALEELKTLLDGAQGEAIDAPHPNTFKNTVTTPLTAWHRSESPADAETNSLGGPLLVEDRDSPYWGRPLTYVMGQIVSVVVLDKWSEQVGETRYDVLHKVANPKMTNKDTSSSRFGPFSAMDLMKRFPDAFVEFETKLRQAGTPLPIAILKDIPPHVLQLLLVIGTKTVEELAAYGDKEMANLKTRLEAMKMHQRVPYIDRYREFARAKVGYAEPSTEAPKQRKSVAA